MLDPVTNGQTTSSYDIDKCHAHVASSGGPGLHRARWESELAGACCALTIHVKMFGS